ncbi:hypothetical protein BC830DRAFT_1226534 [Chytriomyces sp. MP71]|nr:hypothetical protein BC830DRAFT_1226534 [Chytriomyces sp. MP71]
MLSVIVLASLCFNNGVSAFTMGSMLPAYLCAQPGDNMPKSLGGVLKNAVFNKDTPLAFNPTAGNNLAMTAATMNNAPVNTAYMLSSFHNTINSISATQNVVFVTTGATTAGVTTAQAATAGAFTAIQAGAAVPITITSNLLAGGATGTVAGTPLDGTMIWAEDAATGARLGSFTDAGGAFVPFPGCGTDPNTGANVGMVHNQIIAAGGVYTQLTWNAPATLQANQQINMVGLAVSDGGFGFHCQTFTVGATTAPVPCQRDATGAAVLPPNVVAGTFATTNGAAVCQPDNNNPPAVNSCNAQMAAAGTAAAGTAAAGTAAAGGAAAGTAAAGTVGAGTAAGTANQGVTVAGMTPASAAGGAANQGVTVAGMVPAAAAGGAAAAGTAATAAPAATAAKAKKAKKAKKKANAPAAGTAVAAAKAAGAR